MFIHFQWKLYKRYGESIIMKIRWIKVIGIAGTAFFTSLGALLTIDALTSNTIPLSIIIPASFIVSGIQGGLAFFREITTECENKPPKKRKALISISRQTLKCQVNRVLDHMLI